LQGGIWPVSITLDQVPEHYLLSDKFQFGGGMT